MSFTTEIKNELCRIPISAPCCALAECLGMLLYAGRCDREQIRLQAETSAVRRRAAQLLQLNFHIAPQEEKASLTVSGEDAARVLAGFGYDGPGTLQLNRALVEEECCKSAFLRGAFLAGGYVSTPDKGYHLELTTAHYRVARQTSALLLDMELPAGYIQRRGNHVLYLKDSTLIEEFLTAAGATGSAMELMLKKVERDLRNNVNRKVNCETANLSKTVDASARQVAAIETLRLRGMLEELPAPLLETALLREGNPELSLSELCALHKTPISRPGLSNRLRRLVKLSEEQP
ncbi:MAG: DNA-binding protein WhiA [Clostridiaceae bacterium]|nr:DNA-binding protein WhiA [Clostridiaceae bacterium]